MKRKCQETQVRFKQDGQERQDTETMNAERGTMNCKQLAFHSAFLVHRSSFAFILSLLFESALVEDEKMEASEAADQLRELSEAEEEKKDKKAEDKFRGRAAISIAIMAMLLAITSLGGGNVAEDMMSNNIQASDTWAFYQAKSIRQTVNQLAAEELQSQLELHQNSLSPEARQSLEKRIQQYNETAARYESEPDKDQPNNPLKGEGKKELSARAKNFEAQRDQAMKQDTNFDFAEALFQIAIVLASVAILSSKRMILNLSIILGAIALVLMLNGYFLFFTLPF